MFLCTGFLVLSQLELKLPEELAHIGFVPTRTNFSGHNPAARVHVLPRQAGRGQGCSPPPDEGSPEDTAGRHTSCPCVSSLANSLVVASSGGHVGGTIADCYLLLDTILFSCFTSRIRIFEVGAHVFYMYIYYHV